MLLLDGWMLSETHPTIARQLQELQEFRRVWRDGRGLEVGGGKKGA
jgi:hypothetical protein